MPLHATSSGACHFKWRATSSGVCHFKWRVTPWACHFMPLQVACRTVSMPLHATSSRGRTVSMPLHATSCHFKWREVAWSGEIEFTHLLRAQCENGPENACNMSPANGHCPWNGGVFNDKMKQLAWLTVVINRSRSWKYGANIILSNFCHLPWALGKERNPEEQYRRRIRASFVMILEMAIRTLNLK